MLIMIVDDEPALCDVLAVALREEGHEVQTFANGETALQQVTRQATLPGLIILDLMLPGMSGGEVFQALRHDSLLERIPILVVTALAAGKAVVQTQGAVPILQKPFTLDTFLARVTDLVALP
ncbi:MAG TPA: response regulator transcription factor [Roseiflexaceae bacterium]|nr:response regulator transcription factor [Roseiflexaceae bacterium]